MIDFICILFEGDKMECIPNAFQILLLSLQIFADGTGIWKVVTEILCYKTCQAIFMPTIAITYKTLPFPNIFIHDLF